MHSKEVNNVCAEITFIKCYYSFYVVITIAEKLLHRHVFSIIKYFSIEFRKYPLYVFWIWVWNGLQTKFSNVCVKMWIWKIMKTCFANESGDVIVIIIFLLHRYYTKAFSLVEKAVNCIRYPIHLCNNWNWFCTWCLEGLIFFICILCLYWGWKNWLNNIF